MSTTLSPRMIFMQILAQVGEFRISWIISAVPQTQFLRNAFFFKKQNAHNAVNVCCKKIFEWMGYKGVPSDPHDFIHHHGQFPKTSISTFGGPEFCLNFLLMTREYTTPIARYDKSPLG